MLTDFGRETGGGTTVAAGAAGSVCFEAGGRATLAAPTDIVSQEISD